MKKSTNDPTIIGYSPYCPVAFALESSEIQRQLQPPQAAGYIFQTYRNETELEANQSNLFYPGSLLQSGVLAPVQFLMAQLAKPLKHGRRYLSLQRTDDKKQIPEKLMESLDATDKCSNAQYRQNYRSSGRSIHKGKKK